jgi:transposase
MCSDVMISAWWGPLLNSFFHFENIFARLKYFRALATRYDKLKRNYASMVAITCGVMWLPM